MIANTLARFRRVHEKPVYGHRIAPRRVTPAGVGLACIVVLPPLFIAAYAVEALIALLAHAWFGVCLGMFCG